MHELAKDMSHTKRGVSWANRKHQLKTYKDCFVGNKAVDWITHELKCTRERAVWYGGQLMANGLIKHVLEHEPFTDTGNFYKFTPRVDEDISRARFVWWKKARWVLVTPSDRINATHA